MTWILIAILALTDILLQHYSCIIQLGYYTSEQHYKSQPQVGPVQQREGAVATNTLGGEGVIATDTSSASKARCDRGCTHRRQSYRSKQYNTAPISPATTRGRESEPLLAAEIKSKNTENCSKVFLRFHMWVILACTILPAAMTLRPQAHERRSPS